MPNASASVAVASVRHLCRAEVIVYQNKDGFVYYDDLGMTYRGLHDVVHYSRNGEVLYQACGLFAETLWG